MTPVEWDAVRWCEGVHVPLEPWEEEQHRNSVGKGKKATRIQKFSSTRCQARSMHWKSGGLVTEVNQWKPVKWSRDDWVLGFKSGQGQVITPWPVDTEHFMKDGAVDIAMIDTSHAESEYPRETNEAKTKKYISIDHHLQRTCRPQSHLMHKAWAHMQENGGSSMAEMASQLQQVLPSLAKRGHSVRETCGYYRGSVRRLCSKVYMHRSGYQDLQWHHSPWHR